MSVEQTTPIDHAAPAAPGATVWRLLCSALGLFLIVFGSLGVLANVGLLVIQWYFDDPTRHAERPDRLTFFAITTAVILVGVCLVWLCYQRRGAR